MMFRDVIEKKAKDARGVMSRCIGARGLYASPYRYRDQCWTRDFVYAGMEHLVAAGNAGLAERHIAELAVRQKPDGRVPIMFLDNTPRWLWGKAVNTFKSHRISFLLKRYFSKDGIGWLSPWTRDSEFLFALAVGRQARREAEHGGSGSVILDRCAEKALAYVERELVQNGLVRGADWRDTRPDLDGVCLLTNNCWRHQAYLELAHTSSAEALKARIHASFWNGTHFKDYVDPAGNGGARTGEDEFDTLGNALAIIFGIATPEQARSIIERAEALSTPRGYRLNNVTLPPKDDAEAELMSRISQVGVIWPFIHGYMILALLHAGEVSRARTELEKWTTLPGFYEFYDPDTGEGHGSPEQMWSAAMYLRCKNALGM